MGRIIVAFYLAAFAWLAGVGLTAATGAPAALVCGVLGLVGFLAAAAARVAAEQPPAVRRRPGGAGRYRDGGSGPTVGGGG
jgi:hypothetical protein